MPRPGAFDDLGLVIRERFLDERERHQILQAISTSPGEPAEIVTGDGALAADERARRAWDVALADELADTLIDRIESLRPMFEQAFGVRLGPCDGVAALRYPAGGFYGPHRDAADTPDPLGLHLRRVSIVVFVNDRSDSMECFGGGALRFHDLDTGVDGPGTSLDMEPQAGTLVAFRSEILHEVLPVSWGSRCSVVTWLSEGR